MLNWSRLKLEKYWYHFLYADVIRFFATKNVKKREKSVKMVNIEGENLHIFSKTWTISMKFSGKMWLMTILKFTKKSEFYLLSRKHNFGKITWATLRVKGSSSNLSRLLQHPSVAILETSSPIPPLQHQ